MLKLRLFLLSFLTLFLELALIRWIPAYIRPVGYFSNLILLGAFLGIGIGFLWSPTHRAWYPLFPGALLLLLGIITIFRVDVAINSPSMLFYQAIHSDEPLPAISAMVILPFIFISVAVVFSLISHEMGRVFKSFPPLTAYSIDIIGSLAGIGLFTVLSSQGTSAYLWFCIIAIISFLAFVLNRSQSRIMLGIHAIVLFAVVVLSYTQTSMAIWSPYYKVMVTKYNNGYAVNVNNLGHQFIQSWQSMDPLYSTVYDVFPAGNFRRILVIGSGTGNDVALALVKNPHVEHIDAVEIDPTIVSLGNTLHPNQPYTNPKVHVIVADGRNFLERSHQTYDVIIFALTDSLTLTSQMSSVRLESFLYTKEAFLQVKNHLTDNGVFVLYNYYRAPWLIDKLSGMLFDVFHMPVYARMQGDIGWAATLLTGPKTSQLANNTIVSPYLPHIRMTPATDDWPFIYLYGKTIPPFYLQLIGILFTISALATIPVFLKRKNHGFDIRFFLFGAAFLLLETKRIVTFDLLFGATWMVNVLVFTAVLMSILLANIVSAVYTIRKLWVLYLVLFLTIIVSSEIPKTFFLILPRGMRYLNASIIYFSPIFVANLIFSQLFRHTKHKIGAFGSNLLGAVFGGLVEYMGLAIGYWNLNFIIMAFYLTALFIA